MNVQRVSVSNRGQESPACAAWEAARRAGCDMSLIEENLRMTPAERLSAHRRALHTAVLLRQAMGKALAS